MASSEELLVGKREKSDAAAEVYVAIHGPGTVADYLFSVCIAMLIARVHFYRTE